MAQHYDDYDNDEDLFEEERPHRRRGIDLTSAGFRIGATLAVLALALLLIVLVVRPGSKEEILDPVPTPDSSAQSAQPDPLVTFTPGATSTPPPLDEPTPGPAADNPSGSDLSVNGAARVAGTGGAGVNLRTVAGTASDVVQIIPDDTAVTLLEGPTEANGYQWWRVRLEDGTEGWLAQDFLVP